MNHVHWGLARPPFPSGLNPQLFFEGATQREALARLRYLVDHRRRLGLLIGQSGLGKSLLCEVFARQFQSQGESAEVIDLFGLTAREFIWEVGSRLYASVRVEDEPLRLFQKLLDRLRENRILGVKTVLLLDDLDSAGPDTINQLLRLVHLENDRLTIVVVSRDVRLSRLNRELLNLVDLRIDLLPWDELDTTGYLQLALVEAGAEEPLFDDDALTEICRLSGGVVRRVNQLAEYALTLAASGEQSRIDATTVHSAHSALKLPAAD